MWLSSRDCEEQAVVAIKSVAAASARAAVLGKSSLFMAKKVEKKLFIAIKNGLEGVRFRLKFPEAALQENGNSGEKEGQPSAWGRKLGPNFCLPL